MMKIFSSMPGAFCLSLAIVSAAAMSLGQTPKPVVYATQPKSVTARLMKADDASGKGGLALRGKATLTITSANLDDTLTGTLVFSIGDDVRQKIAEISGKPLTSIPSQILKPDVTAAFHSGAACPVVHVEIRKTEFEIGELKAVFNRLMLEIVETRDEIPQLFCTWTRQINAGRQRRGIIAAINRLISPEQ